MRVSKTTSPLGLAFALTGVLFIEMTGLSLPSAGAAISGQETGSPLEVTIKSASGKERYPLCHDNRIDRVGLAPNQSVEIKLKYKGEKKGEQMFVTSFDGGRLSGHQNLSVGAGATVHFTYQAAGLPGKYRVLVRIGDEDYWFDFYVLDLVKPERNPPRVQIVD